MTGFLRLTRIALIVAVAAMALGPARAVADADPASDVLLGSLAFFPYQPPPAQDLQNQLNHVLAELHKEGLGLKVAIIASPIDLGAIPNMFGMPQTYAEFLGREISFGAPQPVLVVMPAGFGLFHAGSPAALAGLKVDASQGSDSLTRSAILAVQRIARAAGKPVPTGTAAAPGSGSGTSPLIRFALPAIVVLLAAFAAAVLQRRGAVRRRRRARRVGGASPRQRRQ